MSDSPGSSGRAMFTRGSSMRVGSTKNPEDFADVSVPSEVPPSRSFKPQFSRHDSVRDHGEIEEGSKRRPPTVTFVEERRLSAREAVAAQEAAEAASSDEEDEDDDENEKDDSIEAEKINKSTEDSEPKQTISLMDLLEYTMEEEEEEEEDEDEEEEEEEEGEISCCICNVKIKGATFTPSCSHTFCKVCSKEKMAQKGHCPVCSSFVLEFLEIF